MHANNKLGREQLAELITNLFSKNMPFNQLLGFEVRAISQDKVEVHFDWHDKLMGNPSYKILHGGVTAAVLDTVGGAMAALYAAKDMQDYSDQAFLSTLSKLGTIDMRVDYLRPGKGESFVASAEVIRKGSKVAVCRMELHNQDNTQIALGTATYMVG